MKEKKKIVSIKNKTMPWLGELVTAHIFFSFGFL